MTVTDGAATLTIQWQGIANLDSRTYTCGHCDKLVGPNTGYYATVYQGGASLDPISILICSSCRQPTYFDRAGAQYPGVPYGNDVGSLPNDVGGLYSEARKAYSVGAYTASVLACRKIL